jgi:hypothetical protein
MSEKEPTVLLPTGAARQRLIRALARALAAERAAQAKADAQRRLQ